MKAREMAGVLDPERYVPATAGSAAGAGGLDEQVAHQTTEGIAAARRDGGTDGVVVGRGDEREVAAPALRLRAGLPPVVVEKEARPEVLYPGTAPVDDRGERTALVELVEDAGETAHPPLEPCSEVRGSPSRRRGASSRPTNGRCAGRSGRRCGPPGRPWSGPPGSTRSPERPRRRRDPPGARPGVGRSRRCGGPCCNAGRRA